MWRFRAIAGEKQNDKLFRWTPFPDRHDHERKDCIIRALSVAANVPYLKAYDDVMATGGRKPQRGGIVPHILAKLKGYAIKQVFWWFEVPDRRNKPYFGAVTLAEFVRRFPKGRYFVIKNSHAFAVVDGKVHDTVKLGARTRILRAWQITPIEPVTNQESPPDSREKKDLTASV
jgi:hypothetical protein